MHLPAQVTTMLGGAEGPKYPMRNQILQHGAVVVGCSVGVLIGWKVGSIILTRRSVNDSTLSPVLSIGKYWEVPG